MFETLYSKNAYTGPASEERLGCAIPFYSLPACNAFYKYNWRLSEKNFVTAQKALKVALEIFSVLFFPVLGAVRLIGIACLRCCDPHTKTCQFLFHRDIGRKSSRESASNHEEVFLLCLIAAINRRKRKLKDVMPGLSASQMMKKLLQNDAWKELAYADFEGVAGFDNDCLEKLVTHCPKLKHLAIPYSQLQNDGMKYLSQAGQLRTLVIRGCKKLEHDALSWIMYTPELEHLDISDCRQLESKALQWLIYTPGLKSLNISHCTQLDRDALQWLQKTPRLCRLRFEGCDQLYLQAFKPTNCLRIGDLLRSL